MGIEGKIELVAYLVGAIGTLITVIGLLFGYIFRRHAKDDDDRHAETRDDIREIMRIIMEHLEGH